MKKERVEGKDGMMTFKAIKAHVEIQEKKISAAMEILMLFLFLRHGSLYSDN